MAHQRQRDISYTLSEDVQTTFPDIVELESDTVKSGLDVAMYYAIAGMFAKNIACDLPSATGTITVNLQSVMDGWHPILEKAHEHDNKSVLDKLSAADGKLQYNGSDVGLKGAAEHRVKTVLTARLRSKVPTTGLRRTRQK